MFSGPDLLIAGVFVLILGGLLGIGCYEGCAYARRHVDVEWVD